MNREQEKLAFDAAMLSGIASHAAHALGTMGALHIGANVALKQFLKGKFKGDVAQRWLGRKGFEHGMNGRQAHPMLMTVGKQFLSPELSESYRIGNHIGTEYAIKGGGMVPAHMMGMLGNKIDKIGPMTKFVHQGIAQSLKNGVPKIPEQASTLAGKLKNKLVIQNEKAQALEASPTFRKVRGAYEGLSAAGALAGIPGLGDHIAVNTVRGAMARTAKGAQSVKQRLRQGFEGHHESKLKRMAIDYVISPGFGAVKDMGANARRELGPMGEAYLKNMNR